MKKLYLLIITTTLCFAALAQNYWQQEVHYTIDVSLNDQAHSLDGFLKLKYVNHSPDSLSFIWFHLWPNAFKNDQTAFTEQTLRNGRTDFYFATREQRGYINRLDFRVNNNTLRTEDHPQHIDIIKVYLPAPLAPGASTEITTPFHVQLPKNFSRGGHTDHSYQITQWYPKPAVYDRFGWHPMPYLDQGEFYSEFGSFDVRITVPEAYVVAATGEMKEEVRNTKSEVVPITIKKKPEVKKKTVSRLKPSRYARKPSKTAKPAISKDANAEKPPSAAVRVRRSLAEEQGLPQAQQTTPGQRSLSGGGNNKLQTFKTVRYVQDKVHDFAWFADTAFEVKQDTIQIDGRVIHAYCYYDWNHSKAWISSMQHIKNAVRFRSKLIGAYPYNVVKVVAAKMGFPGGMEYPTITSVSPNLNDRDLAMVIEHEIGHNWFYGILASNERDHPWMDEGINTYYDNRYKASEYAPSKMFGLSGKLPEDPEWLTVDAMAKIKKDQPVTTASADFTSENYGVIAYLKTAALLQQMEAAIGTERFDSCMRVYYEQWKFKHPYPQDFQQILQSCAGKDLSPFFEAMQHKGPVKHYTGRKKLQPALVYNFNNYERVNYINVLPALGYNLHDKFMIGLGIHNYTIPAHNFQFFVAPLYATGSKQFNGIGRLGYTWRTNGAIEKIEAAVSGSRFSIRDGADSNFNKVNEDFYKVVPSLRLTFKNESVRSSLEKWLEWKTFVIGEQKFKYFLKESEGVHYPFPGEWTQRYLNQLSFGITDYRALYPYDVLLQVQQGDGFYRATAEGHYFFNYGTKGGLQMRVFAAKFGYIGEKTAFEKFDLDIYKPKLTAIRGGEDYTYSNYFIGRNEVDGLASQQIMIRDGGLKLRVDQFPELQGRSDNWIASMNLNTTLPNGLFPVELPVRIFLDIGTYAEAWKKDAATNRFLYVGGLQVSLFKDLLNVYAPILYSKEFRDHLKTVPDENTFGKKISFSIDVHRFNLRKVAGNKIIPL